MANMFNEDGTYNKTEWKAGDRITAVKLNKIELSLETINNNDIDRHVEADSRLDILEERMANTPDNGQMDALEDMVKDNKDVVDLAMYNINSKIESLENHVDDILSAVSDDIDTLESRADGVDYTLSALSDDIDTINDSLDVTVKDISVLKTEHVNVLEYGAVGDGINDDTTAFENAIATGKTVFIPMRNRVYKVNRTLYPLKNQIIYGDTSISKRNKDETDYGITTDMQDLTIFDLSNKQITLRNIRLFSDEYSGIGVANVYDGRLYDIEITKFDIGINSVTGSSELIGAKAHKNNTGLRFVVDSRIIACHFQLNNNYGIHLSAGSGDVQIIGSKFDWNNRYNMFLSKAQKILIIGCVIDRATQNGIMIQESNNITLSSNLLRRNYISDESGYTICQLYCLKSSNISISDNQIIKAVGSDDVEDVVEYPSGTVYIQDCSNVKTSGNTLTGVLRDQIVFGGTNTNISLNDKKIYKIEINSSVCDGRALISNHIKIVEFNTTSKKDMTGGTEYVITSNSLLGSLNGASNISGYTYVNKNQMVRYVINSAGDIKIIPVGGDITSGDIINFSITYY